MEEIMKLKTVLPPIQESSDDDVRGPIEEALFFTGSQDGSQQHIETEVRLVFTHSYL
jgi:hypothetical protein